MEIPSYTTFILNLINKIDTATQSFIALGFQNLANYLQTPIALASTLLIILIGYGILQGFVQMSFKTFNKLALTIGGVYLLGFSWAYFNSYFIALFLDSANEIAAVLIQGQSFHFPILPGTGTGVNAALQTVLIEAVKVGGWVMAKAGFTDLLPYFIGLNFMLCGTLVVALATVEVIVVKLYLAMLLAVAPFFISTLILPQTKGLFDGWLSQLKGFAIALILLGIAVGLCMYLMHWVVGGYFLEKAVNVKLYSVVPLFIASVLCLLLLIGIIPIAKQIGGTHGGSGWSAVGGALTTAAAFSLSTAMKGLKGGKGILSSKGMKGLPGTSISSLSFEPKLSAKQTFSNIRNQSQKGSKP